MEERTKIALELAKAYIGKADHYDFNDTDEILCLAVVDTDMLLNLLAKPVGTVSYENLLEEQESLEEKEESMEELVEETNKKKGWF